MCCYNTDSVIEHAIVFVFEHQIRVQVGFLLSFLGRFFVLKSFGITQGEDSVILLLSFNQFKLSKLRIIIQKSVKVYRCRDLSVLRFRSLLYSQSQFQSSYYPKVSFQF